MNFRIITDEGDGFILQRKRGFFWECARWDRNKVEHRFGSIQEAKQWAAALASELKRPEIMIVEEFHIN